MNNVQTTQRFSTTLLPAALRDTALTVTTLPHAEKPELVEDLRERCTDQIAALRAELKADGHARDVIEDAIYAQCALLDEAALSNLQGDERDRWESEPLQVSEFQTHHAGEELIARIERRLAQPQPVLPLLAIFGSVFHLGFKGKFVVDGHDARTSLVRALDARLAQDAGRNTSASVIVSEPVIRPLLDRLSLPAWVATSCVAAGLIYLALDRWLFASIAQLTH